MTPDTTEPTTPGGARAGGRRPPWRALLATLGLSVLGAIAVMAGHRVAPSAVVDVGPTDGRYVRGFRDLERDGAAYFRWSSIPSSGLELPLRFCGPGQLRLRVRRHFVDPALLSASLSGALLGQRAISAREDHPYEVIEFPVSKIACESNALVLLETSVQNDRPLGVAVDWAEVIAPAGFGAAPETILRGGALVGITTVAFLASGSGIPVALAAGGLVSGVVGLAFASEPVAAERMLRGGLDALGLTLILGFLIARTTGVLTLSARHRTALTAMTVVAVLCRSAFLHQLVFYPDYRVHALVQQTLNRGGLVSFLDQLFEIQYARSLGLQQIGGNWYPFPYPPGAYVLTGLVGGTFGLDSLDAATVTAVCFASLIPLLTLSLGLALGLGPLVGLMGALWVSIHPLLIRRLALGYFPGVAGQFADGVSLLLFLTAVRGGARPVLKAAWLATALSLAFLVYTQSIANFGLLIAGLLLVEAVWPGEEGRSGALRVAVVGILALTLSAGAFYWRYLPVLENIERATAQPEARVLDRLEEMRKTAPSDARAADTEDLNDPYAGSTLSPLRGVARLGSRLWRFNGPFVLLLAIGSAMLLRQSGRSRRNVLLAWGAVAVWISLLAAGLPSPNGFQHLKDLEFVTPLAALAMAFATVRLGERRPAAAGALVCAWLVFAGMALRDEWTARLLDLSGR